MPDGKVMIIHLRIGLMKKILLYKNEFFPPYSYIKNKIEVKSDLSDYATKYDLNSATVLDTSQFTKKDDLANLKSEFDQLDIDKLAELDANKLKLAPFNLRK